MDYPLSDSNARLVGGKFTDGDPVNAVPPSKNSAEYQNAVYDELLNVIAGGDVTPNEATFDQLFTAIGNIAKSVVSSQTAGQISNFPGTAVPDGWLKANGQTVSRIEYSYLWSYAQSSSNIAANEGAKTDGQFGPGNGSTTFSLPDLRGVHLRNWDDGKGTDTGRSIGSDQADQNKSHNHGASTASAGSHSHSAVSTAAGGHSHTQSVRVAQSSSSNVLAGASDIIAGNIDGTVVTTNKSTSSVADHSHSITVESAGSHSHTVTINSDGGTETRVKNIATMVCIKY
jgi:microcystin-dependent protein